MKKRSLLDLNMSVSNLLEEWPEVIPIFLRHHMACVGCSMSSFETLGDAARIYGVRPQVFLDEIKYAIENSSSPDTQA